jgi:hypothetical protein
MRGKIIRVTKNAPKKSDLGESLTTNVRDIPSAFARRLAMGYALAMSAKFLPVASGIIFLFAAASWLRADEVEMQNGDRYFGHVLSVSADTVVLESEVLGKLNVPRKNVAGLAFGTNAVAPKAAPATTPVSIPTNLPPIPASIGGANTNLNLSAALRNSSVGTNIIRQIREQMLAASPEAAGKYDAMVNGLLDGSINMDDLKREAQADADQLRALKRDLGPDAAESLDGYLDVLDDFLKESDSADTPTNAAVPRPKALAH